jgi:predicted MFS family arabinose efflux permease
MDQLSPAVVRPFLRSALAGASATLSGIGLARFSFVPLFPAMVAAGWVTGPEAGLLGATNLAGYLAGVLGGRAIAHRIETARALDLGMALAAVSFAACTWNGGVMWLALWRGLAGLAGGILMALAGPAVQGAVDASRRGAAGGIVIAGVGSGIVIASLAVPALLPAGLSIAWLGLAALVLALWAFARSHWPNTPVAAPDALLSLPSGKRVLPLYLLYGFAGAGTVPHMIYFVDLAVRGRGLGGEAGGLLWLIFGVGAVGGTLAGGRAADRWGGVIGLKVWLASQAIAAGLACLPGIAVLVPSALLGGFGGVGITAVALARTRELAGPGAGAIWVRATAIFALVQAATAFGLAPLFAATGSHEALFAAGFVFSLIALVSGLWEGRQLNLPARRSGPA